MPEDRDMLEKIIEDSLVKPMKRPMRNSRFDDEKEDNKEE